MQNVADTVYEAFNELLSQNNMPLTSTYPFQNKTKIYTKVAYIIALIFSQRNNDIDHPWGWSDSYM